MTVMTARQVADRAFDLCLLTEQQLKSAWGQFGGLNVSADAFVQLLLRRELLTSFQATKLLKGERSGFFYGDYKVLYLIGEGTFARVYRAVNKYDGQVVAVKVLRHRFSDDPRYTERFQREGELCRSLNHPNIVAVHEVVSRGTTHYLVMEFVEGRTLREFIQVRKTIDPYEATRLMIDVASGLAYAAERGIAHRDLKVSNVLVSTRGEAKLADFGLANGGLNDDELANCINPRTIDYVGLERATGSRNDDLRSDVFFAGAIYYHMLVGRSPLSETRERIERLNKSRFLEIMPIYEAAPQLPTFLAAVVGRAMHLLPDQRYPTATEFLADLKHAFQRLTMQRRGSGEPTPKPGPDGSMSDTKILAKLPDSARRPIMFVESNAKIQEIFRGGLKDIGYRALLTNDPEWAIDRFADDRQVADAVIFSTSELGTAALDAFNRFSTDDSTKHIPSVLLLGERHKEWAPRGPLGKQHLVLRMPLLFREFRKQLARVVPPAVPSAK